MLGSRVWISGLCLRVKCNTECRLTVLLVNYEGGVDVLSRRDEEGAAASLQLPNCAMKSRKHLCDAD
jgi:hypothetical protein